MAAIVCSLVPPGICVGNTRTKAADRQEGLIASFDFDDEEGLKGAGAVASVNGEAAFTKSFGGAGNAISLGRNTWLSITKEEEIRFRLYLPVNGNMWMW